MGYPGLADEVDRVKCATVAFRYRSLQQFFKWLVEEDELDTDPMPSMRGTHVPRNHQQAGQRLTLSL